MDQSIEVLTSNPVYMAVAVVLAIVILLGVIKKLLKLVLVVSAILVLWVAYMVWSGQDVTVDRLKEGIQSGVETVKEKASATR
jgi:ABC-type transport system involved in cytochrome bd biosynthesis fused ATPase/permease subunit